MMRLNCADSAAATFAVAAIAACTFGGPLAANAAAGGVHIRPDERAWDYDPYNVKTMEEQAA